MNIDSISLSICWHGVQSYAHISTSATFSANHLHNIVLNNYYLKCVTRWCFNFLRDEDSHHNVIEYDTCVITLFFPVELIINPHLHQTWLGTALMPLSLWPTVLERSIERWQTRVGRLHDCTLRKTVHSTVGAFVRRMEPMTPMQRHISGRGQSWRRKRHLLVLPVMATDWVGAPCVSDVSACTHH